MPESLKDKCGVFGVFSKGEDVARISFYGLYSLQHRGQEGAGIAVSDGQKIRCIKGLGLVPSVFDEKSIESLKGYIAVGHTRYSTTGGNTLNNTQPIIIDAKDDRLAIAHNGNITNALALLRTLPGIKLNSTSDTEVLGIAINNAKGKTWEDKIRNTMGLLEGAYSIVAITKKKLLAFRDPYGFRPLVLGKLNGGYVVCSETCALETVGAKYIRDIKPGEIITIDDTGIKESGVVVSKRKSFCLFEYVYLARPDSILNKELVHQVRQRSGEILAFEAPVAADMVAAIPDSGTSAAIGYSKASGIPFGEILIKNRYIGRTFIQPEQRIRDMGVKIKFNPLKKVVKGKRIVIVDDSIVRGTTIRKIIQVLRKYGAKKIHVRVTSPPVKYSCFFGVDTPETDKLIASHKSVAEIKKHIGADSLEYISLEGLVRAARQKKNSICAACFDGKYPVKVDINLSKSILERKNRRLAILISGGGTTAEAVIKAAQGKVLDITPVVVISSRPDASGIAKAKALGIPVEIIEKKRYRSSEEFGKKILAVLKKYEADFISQNGWLPLTPVNVIRAYQGKIINQHPGPLDPGRGMDFGGKGMYGARVIASRLIYSILTGADSWTEATVHLVTDNYDEGNIIRKERLNFLTPFSFKTTGDLMKEKQELIKITKDIQKKFLQYEHKNVIEALKMCQSVWPTGERRQKPLVPAGMIRALEKSKQLSILLFPNG